MADEGDHYYTVDEAARLLGLSPARVRQMCRSGELEGERREGRIEGVLGPWAIPKRAVRTLLRGGAPAVDRAGGGDAGDHDATTATRLPGGTPAGVPPSKAPPGGGERTTDTLAADTPSEASELLSESVRELRERAEALVREFERLEGRLELAEIQDFTLREALRREMERFDGLRAELEAERARWRRNS